MNVFEFVVENLPYFEKAAGILGVLLTVVTTYGQLHGLGAAQKQADAIDKLRAKSFEQSDLEQEPLTQARRKLQARMTSLILVPGTRLYFYIWVFLICLAVVFFAEGEGRNTLGWNLMIMIIMAFGSSGVIRVAGARRAVYMAVLQGKGNLVQVPERFFSGGLNPILFRFVFALIAMLTTVSSIVIMFLIILGDWGSAWRMFVLVVLSALICWQAWSYYVSCLLADQPASIGAMGGWLKDQVKHKFGGIKFKKF